MIVNRIIKSPSTKAIFSTFTISSLCCILIPIILFSCERPAQQPEVQKPGVDKNQLMLSDNQITLANITTQKIAKGPLKLTEAIVGRLASNEQQRDVISTRASGRIVKLYVKESGVAVKKGMPLYTLYSETLLTLQQEYVLAKTQVEGAGKTNRGDEAFLEAAIRKLTLYGFTSKQIASLNGTTSILPEIIFYAPVSGIVTEVSASEGQQVREGSLMYKLERSDKLWVEAEIYPNETASVSVGDTITVRTNTNEEIQTTVSFISPAYRSNEQVTILRAAIDNIEGKLKSGEHVQIYLRRSSRRVLTVPANAVIRTRNGAYLFVRQGNNTFQPRSVQTGIEDARHVEIIKGIAEGDTVVVSGAYLLYSEFVLKRGQQPLTTFTNQ